MKRTTTTEKEREKANQISEESAHKSTAASQETDKGGSRGEPRQIDISIAEHKILWSTSSVSWTSSGMRAVPSTIFNARPDN